ncbi:hypothetical protein SAMN02745165_01924 [Malonomonas rubra DSM 5091]|uniref:NHL repeat-containing protein n=1 Tax=Malonomonas rubra DSM 5091 TaxID=1122189 RepID=A0A1M6HY28_MALRU|nr:hypothetical protein [Malonomonas rubra]SHJ27139.1 hypothetical protein SAMN02745165_01924 [Malonomonas rubra DSM 5091]
MAVMMPCRFHIATLVALTLLIASAAQAQLSASYLYRLSDFNGPVESLWARLAIDPEQGEVYTLDRSDKFIGIYNQTAMQTFGFGEDLRLASASDIAAGDNGEIFILYRHPASSIKHLDYRGAAIADIRIEQAGFQPDYIDYQAGKLYLADSGSMRVLVASTNGDIEEDYDFRKQINVQIKESIKNSELNEAQRKSIREDLEKLSGAIFGGFGVDRTGNIYFTLGSLFTAYRYFPQNDQLQAFGTPGSAPGKFGVVASICADSQGNIYVSDRLRCVVLMFDAELNYQNEFGYRGSQAHNLVVPDDIAIDEKNHRLYVAQAANRGVSVFSLAAPAAAKNKQLAEKHLALNPERRSENETSQTATVDM